METVLMIPRPKGRGRFCERDIWNEIHRDRFNRWLDGDSIADIAQTHQVTARSVHSSVAKVLAHLHRDDRRQALQYRHNSKYGWKIQDAALIEYRTLMDPSWLFAQTQEAIRRAARAGRSRKR
jgi:hypothetical protein